MIQETSLEAYRVLQPELGSMQNMVYNLLKVYPGSSNHDLSRISGYEINKVTPRVKELRDKGLVVCSGHKKDRVTRRRVMCWMVVNGV